MSDFARMVSEIDDQIKSLKEQKKKVLSIWIDSECPVKIGDVVEVNRYSFRGKRMIVDHISIIRGFREWCAAGKIFKKDGTPGLQRGEWHQRMEE